MDEKIIFEENEKENFEEIEKEKQKETIEKQREDVFDIKKLKKEVDLLKCLNPT